MPITRQTLLFNVSILLLLCVVANVEAGHRKHHHSRALIHHAPPVYGVVKFAKPRYQLRHKKHVYEYSDGRFFMKRHGVFEVVAAPAGSDQALFGAVASGSLEVFAYPRNGQTAERQDRDYYDCHIWAVAESDYDPSIERQDIGKAKSYRRALSACLSGRGYSVK